MGIKIPLKNNIGNGAGEINMDMRSLYFFPGPLFLVFTEVSDEEEYKIFLCGCSSCSWIDFGFDRMWKIR